MASESTSSEAASADHLCVLVHGLWGNPSHLDYLSTSLREQFPADKLHILVATRNIGNFTYDGIELGGERVANEIEEKLSELAKQGHEIKKISITGYSLGGLVARYAIGLLYRSGLFYKVQPVNFTTFATPHLGVRSPQLGVTNQIFNVLGARTLSASGRQLFLIDTFRDTGRPLLSVLADPDSIFIRALSLFKNRTLYANAINDRTVPFYTGGISKTNPFNDKSKIKLNYLSEFEPNILDPENPVSIKDPEPLGSFPERLSSGTRAVFGNIPTIAFLSLLLPIGISLFLVNAGVQSVRSRQRIRMHEEGKAGIDIGRYRIPLMLNGMRQGVEDMFENVNNAQGQQYLPGEGDQPSSPLSPKILRRLSRTFSSSKKPDIEFPQEPKKSADDFPTLALTDDQFAMIDSLDKVGFKKYNVYIHKHRHTHAAIIVRIKKSSFDEGKLVVKHWLTEFEI